MVAATRGSGGSNRSRAGWPWMSAPDQRDGKGVLVRPVGVLTPSTGRDGLVSLGKVSEITAPEGDSGLLTAAATPHSIPLRSLRRPSVGTASAHALTGSR